MNLSFVIYSLGKLLEVLALVMVIPLTIAIGETNAAGVLGEILNGTVGGFCLAIFLTGCAGAGMVLSTRGRRGQAGMREGFAIVTLGWVLFTVLGGIPFVVYFLANGVSASPEGVVRAITDACFETMSGFTTTGASILPDVEVLPRSLLFWRALTQWLGGMGIVTLALVIFPAFGVGAYAMFRSEVPGPTKDRFTPRVAQTAMVLWGIYAVLTVVQTGLLMLGGLSLFDATCHAFATVATGGFSTRNLSIGGLNSAYIEWVVIAFMFLAGMNFMIHYRVVAKGDFGVLRRDGEFLLYLGLVILAAVVIAVSLKVGGLASHDQVARSYRSTPLTEETIGVKREQEQARISALSASVRHAAFQVVSIMTTTGFCTADFDVWPEVARFSLVVLMFVGGCAGSTGGGMKVVRILVVLKAAWREVRAMIQPRLILPLKVSGATLEEKLVASIMAFFIVYVSLYALCTALMAAMVPDLTTAATAVAAAMCNVGPGLSGVGPMETYAWIPVPGKWVLIAAMLLGRLEIYTVIVALVPAAWKK